MNIKLPLLALLPLLLAAPAFAGDPAAGAELFKKCKACHSVIAPDGTEIQKGGRTGPNLYGLMGRQIGAEPGFNYGPGMVAAGDGGARWDEANLTAYLADPTQWVQQATGDSSARSKMSFKLTEGASDIAAYLGSAGQ